MTSQRGPASRVGAAAWSPPARIAVLILVGLGLAVPVLVLLFVAMISATGCFMSCSEPDLASAFAAAWGAATGLVAWLRLGTWATGWGAGRWSWRGGVLAVVLLGMLLVGYARVA